MIKVLIGGTTDTPILSMIDPITGIDWVKDFIGNHGAFIDGQFSLIEGSDIYVADQETYDWWSKVLADQAALAERISDINDEEVNCIVSSASECDLEDQAARVNAALDEAYGAQL
ncbi:hypothetical protein [Paenibacillus amylolyticus]|uniref:hypothetical protein n=1 Tax=Paenibacillus amylolyticus TaxID=1451 RepID=UPI003394E63E